MLFFLRTALPLPFGAVVLTFSRTSKSSAPEELDGASSSSMSESESVDGLERKRDMALLMIQIGTRTRAVSLMVGWASSLGWWNMLIGRRGCIKKGNLRRGGILGFHHPRWLVRGTRCQLSQQPRSCRSQRQHAFLVRLNHWEG